MLPNWLSLSVGVAPRAGAWIETWSIRELMRWWPVAPRAGAWIETDRDDRRCAG